MKKKPHTGVRRGVRLKFKAEENLKRSLSVLQATLDSTADGILVVDSQGKIERFNKKFLEMWRIPPAIIESREVDKAIAFVLDQLKAPEQFLKKVRDPYAQPDATSADTLEFKDGRVFERYSQPQMIDGKRVGRVWSFRDVTESARASRELHSSEKKFRALFENVLDGMYQSTPGGRLLTVNPAMIRMLGYDSEQELLKADIASDLYVDPQQRLSLMKKYDLDGFVRSEELTLRRKDGVAITVLENSRTVRDKNGKILYYEGTLTDITKLKRSEEELKRSEERYRSLFENMLEGYAYCKMLFERDKPQDFVYIAVNNAFEKLTGLKNVVGRKVTEVIPGIKESNPELFEIYGRVALTGTPERFETYVEPLAIWFSISVYCPEKEYFVAAFDNITERKRAEDVIRRQQAYFENLFENSTIPIAMLDKSEVILDINKAFELTFQYTTEEIAGKNINDVIVPDSLREEGKELTERARNKQNIQKETVRKRKDGKLVDVGVHGFPIIINGELVGIYGVYEDISERKKLENQFLHAQRLESIGTLAGGIAHDFNNLLAIINGYATLLKKDEKDAAKRAIWSEAINKAVERGANVVRQLLTFAHKDAVEFVPIDVNKLIEEFMKLIRETFPESVESQIKLQPTLPAIIGDAGQLHQALLNLCLNARDSMPSGGTITITTNVHEGKHVKKKFSEAQAHQYVVVEVRDTGVGISKDTQARMFEPFFTTKEFGAGTGLGLAVVYGVVRAHQAFVDVDSQVGKGTSIRLYFAAETTASPRVEERREVYIATIDGTETILLVEDDPMILDLLKEVLESGGYSVMVAQNGEEAVELYSQAKDKIALVFSDMGLPKLGGWEAFQKMKQVNPRVKAILASGYLDPNLRTEMIKSGARDFIQKPYIPDQILRRVREVIDSTS